MTTAISDMAIGLGEKPNWRDRANVQNIPHTIIRNVESFGLGGVGSGIPASSAARRNHSASAVLPAPYAFTQRKKRISLGQHPSFCCYGNFPGCLPFGKFLLVHLADFPEDALLFQENMARKIHASLTEDQ